MIVLSVDSYAQREEARKVLSQDERWMNYLKKMLKMLVKQVLLTESIKMQGW